MLSDVARRFRKAPDGQNPSPAARRLPAAKEFCCCLLIDGPRAALGPHYRPARRGIVVMDGGSNHSTIAGAGRRRPTSSKHETPVEEDHQGGTGRRPKYLVLSSGKGGSGKTCLSRTSRSSPPTRGSRWQRSIPTRSAG